MAVGAAELGIIAFILLPFLAGVALAIWSVVDIAKRSEEDFAAIGSSRTGWLVGVLLTSLLCGLGIVVGPFYLLAVRPKLDRSPT